MFRLDSKPWALRLPVVLHAASIEKRDKLCMTLASSLNILDEIIDSIDMEI